MKFGFSAALLAACLACSGANAATFDFGADANAFWFVGPEATRYEGTFDQVYDPLSARSIAAGTNGGNSDDGITVTASATTEVNGQVVAADPFMDSRGPFAGLGVCSSGTQSSGISECSSNGGAKPGDDNLLFTELLTLEFGGLTVDITGLQIRDAKHDLINNTANAILINGTAFGTGANGMVNLSGLIDADSYTFTSGASGEEIYLSVLEVSKVPLPAAGFLLIGAIGGLGAMSRRRKA